MYQKNEMLFSNQCFQLDICHSSTSPEIVDPVTDQGQGCPFSFTAFNNSETDFLKKSEFLIHLAE